MKSPHDVFLGKKKGDRWWHRRHSNRKKCPPRSSTEGKNLEEFNRCAEMSEKGFRRADEGTSPKRGFLRSPHGPTRSLCQELRGLKGALFDLGPLVEGGARVGVVKRARAGADLRHSAATETGGGSKER